MASTARHHFEVVFKADGIRVTPHGERLQAHEIAGLKARVFFLMPGAKTFSDPYNLQPVPSRTTGQEASADCLGLDMDLTGVPAEGTRVTFQVWGLSDPAEPKAEFTVPFAISQPAEIVTAKATEADKLGVAAQATCPIGGDDLNAMGGPIKVSRGDESLFVCCQGCLDPIKAEPD